MQYLIMFLASVFPYVAQFIGASITRVVVSLGFGTVAFAGVGFIFDTIIDKLNTSTNAVTPLVAQFIHLAGIDTAINILLSAGFALLVLKGTNKAGSMRKQVWRKPGDKSDVSWDA
jgi:hypothetical protein